MIIKAVLGFHYKPDSECRKAKPCPSRWWEITASHLHPHHKLTLFKITADQGSSFLIITPRDRGSLGTMPWFSFLSHTQEENSNLPPDTKGREKLHLWGSLGSTYSQEGTSPWQFTLEGVKAANWGTRNTGFLNLCKAKHFWAFFWEEVVQIAGDETAFPKHSLIERTTGK